MNRVTLYQNLRIHFIKNVNDDAYYFNVILYVTAASLLDHEITLKIYCQLDKKK